MSSEDRPPIACNMEALTSVERARHAELADLLKASITGVDQIPEGYAATVALAPGLTESVKEWIGLERRCCPFFQIFQYV